MGSHKAQPICIAGIGRSGTTIFFKVLASHPDLGWVSNVIEKVPGLPQLAVFSRLHPLVERLGTRSRLSRYIPGPSESIHSIRKCSNGLFTVHHVVLEEEISPEVIHSVREYHARILRCQGRQRLVTKHTGFPRFRFWRKVYPEAKLIQILRDGRAVVNSLMNVSWWRGTPDAWMWGPIPENYLMEYENSGRRRSVLAAIGWKRLMDLYEQEADELPAGMLVKQVRYNEFTANPLSVMREVAEFADLPQSPKFERSIKRFQIRDADTAWRTSLSPEDLAHVERVIGDHLSRYGFS